MNFIGYVWADHGVELKKAEKLIRKALKLREGDALIKDSLGWVLFKKKKFEEARTFLEEAHKLEPKESIIAEHLADTLVKLNNLEEAQKFYELAVKLDPDTQEAKDLIQEKLAALRRGQPLDPCEPKSFNEKISGSECNTARIRNQNLRAPTSEK
jgi:tetratricopeptide (TPR) repeat protein